jgi:superfamily II DNA/RNA helicase
MTQLDTIQEQFDAPSMEAASFEADSHIEGDITEDVPMSGFEQLELNPALLQAVAALGYTDPTAVQVQTIPAALAGGDWMVSSQTGSGKTAAFLLPAIHALLEAPAMSKGEQAARGRRAAASPRVLVLAPTRELAQQVAQEAIGLVRFCRGVRIANVVGGTAFGKQLMDLRGATLVVATPGRLLDLNRNGQIDLNAVQTLVVDEADRMLDLGFSEDLEAIHVATMKRDRTMMFSATFAPRIMALASNVMRSPQKIELTSAHDTHANIKQSLLWFDDITHKNVLLEHYLQDESMEQAVVFTATQIEADELAEELRDAGYSAAALHGAMPQTIRNRRIRALREGTTKILVATDVAARGIDVPTITHVINYGLPMKPEDYVHRIGRTGRAGRDGVAITLAGGRDRYKIRNIEHFTQQRLEVVTVPGHEPTMSPQAPRFGSGRGGPPRSNDRGRGGYADRAPRESFGGSRGNFGGERNFSAPREERSFRAPREERSFAAPRETQTFAAPERREPAPSPYAAREDRGNFARRAPSESRGHEAQREGSFAPREQRAWQPRDAAAPAFRQRPDFSGHRGAPREDRAPRGDFASRNGGWSDRSERRESSFARPRFDEPRAAHAVSAPAARPAFVRTEREATPFVHQPRAERRGNKPAGPAVTPPAAGGNRAARRAALQAEYAAKVARGEAE